MRIYLAVTQTGYMSPEVLTGADVLSSYWYMRKNSVMIDALPKMRDFMLDSGIFTFINSGKRVDIEKYLIEYSEFIKQYNIRNYVELDVDQILGVSETRKLRDRLEARVGWPSIPVWHTVRGKESFLHDCRDYKRICLGYYLTEGISSKLTEKYTPWFIDNAHDSGCRIHGLGFTKTTMLPKFHFDSVDSSTWSFGQRGGWWFQWDVRTHKMIQNPKPEGTRIHGKVQYKALIEHNFKQWRLYQDYARKTLFPIW